MTTTTFHPEILLSATERARFFEGREEAISIGNYRADPQRAGRWDVTCLSELTELYHLTNAFFLMMTSYLLHGLCMTDLSKRLWVLSRHEHSEGTVIKTQRVFQENFLVRSINTYRKDIADFYLQSPIHFFLPGQTETCSADFFRSNGLCRGMCHWFVYLYFKTIGQFTTAEEHVRAVGAQFEQGASRQAAFLQGLNPLPALYELLRFHIQADYLNTTLQGKTHAELIRQIQSFEPGVYGIYVGNH